MSAKNNSDSEYYGRDLVRWCHVCNMSAKNNSDSEYYGRDLCNHSQKNVGLAHGFKTMCKAF